MENKYNGWSNYATWRVNMELVDGIHWSENETTFKDVSSLSEYIKDSVHTMVKGDLADCTALEYAIAFVGDVNFYEIAQAVAESNPKLITGEDTQDGEEI